jgi:hypothetical protein
MMAMIIRIIKITVLENLSNDLSAGIDIFQIHKLKRLPRIMDIKMSKMPNFWKE